MTPTGTVAQGVWLSRPIGPLAGWFNRPAGASVGLGVLMLPPVGYESSSSHRAWRRIAEALAARGCLVLRIDYPGTGDSAGQAGEIGDLAPWRAAIPAGMEALRDQGAANVALVGCRVGASLALEDGPALGAAAIVAVGPVVSGRRYVRQLTMLGTAVPDEPGALAFAGTLFTGGLLGDLKHLDITAAVAACPVPLLLVDGPGPLQALTEAAGVPTDGADHGVSVEATTALEAFLERPAEEAEVDPGLVHRVADWVAQWAPSPGGQTDLQAGAPRPLSEGAWMTWDGAPIHEQMCRVGADGLVGVLTTTDPARRETVVVLVNSGSDPHTGPGRAWVELGRELAQRGYAALRVDLRGWGESPDGPTVPGRPYDAHGVGDVEGLVEALRADGWQRVVLAGLCAGAWVALDVARRTPLDGVIALNPQLYWQPGDPVEALLATTRVRRTDEIAAIKEAGAEGRWDREDEQGTRPAAARWLDDLVERRVPVLMLFADGDDGLEYIGDRLGRRLRSAQQSGVVRVEVVPGIDHGMHRTWLRPVLYRRFIDGLAAMQG